MTNHPVEMFNYHIWANQTILGRIMPEAFQKSIPLNMSILDSVDEYANIFAQLSEQYKEWLQNQTDLEQTILLDNPFAGIRQSRDLS